MNNESIKRMLLGLSFMIGALYIEINAGLEQLTHGFEFLLFVFGIIFLLIGYFESDSTNPAESDDVQNITDPDAHEINCPHCGKSIDADFPICPFCGHQR